MTATTTTTTTAAAAAAAAPSSAAAPPPTGGGGPLPFGLRFASVKDYPDRCSLKLDVRRAAAEAANASRAAAGATPVAAHRLYSDARRPRWWPGGCAFASSALESKVGLRAVHAALMGLGNGGKGGENGNGNGNGNGGGEAL
jgi:hypothetical protein